MSEKNYTFWKQIWDTKGNSETNDLLFLDGYDHLNRDISSQVIAHDIIKTLSIEEGSQILEVGCGCGFLSREFVDLYSYVGVDYSQSIIGKHQHLFNHEVYCCPADQLFFEDKTFDYVFCYGLFQYLPSHEYANIVLDEFERVSRKGILLGDLKTEQTRETHLIYPKSDLRERGYNFTACSYDPTDPVRFNAVRQWSTK